MIHFENALQQVLTPSTWEKSNDVFYFTAPCDFAENQTLNGSIDSVENSEIATQLIPHIQKTITGLEDLVRQAKQLIAENHPESDCENLPFNEIMIQKNSAFSLGFDTGESPAGNLFIFVEYDKDFKQNPKLIYEIY